MSSLQVDNIQTYNSNPPVIKNVSGTEVGTFCRAWVNFNGTGVVAIRQSFNVSSITDNGTGDYTVNFTTAITDANYGVAATAEWNPGVDFKRASARRGAMATGSVRLGVDSGSGTSADSELVFVAIFR